MNILHLVIGAIITIGIVLIYMLYQISKIKLRQSTDFREITKDIIIPELEKAFK